MLLEVRDLHVEFRTRDGIARAVNGVSYGVDAGETLAVLGESGSGKSVTAQAIMGILDSPPGFVTGGEIVFKGRDLLKLGAEERRKIRGEQMAMIFQDALSALNPVHSVGTQLGEMYRVHRGSSRKEARAKAIELMDRVRIPVARERASAYPHELSGGQRQRIGIARALAVEPKLIICDEPVSALDVSIRSQILNLLRDLQDRFGLAYIFVSHDLAVVKHIADRVAVMNLGGIVETAAADALFAAPRHPYSRALLSAIPVPKPQAKRSRIVLEGEMPSALNPPAGCRFHTRCPYVIARCRTEIPPLLADDTGHATACHRTVELPVPENIVPADGGFSPVLEKLVAAFSGGTEGAAPTGVGISGTRTASA